MEKHITQAGKDIQEPDMKIIIVSHTEFGISEGKKLVFYKYDEEMANKSISNTMKLVKKYDAKICFAMTPGLAHALTKENAMMLKDSKQVEIGLHIHPDHKFLLENGFSGNTSRALRDYTYAEQKKMIGFGSSIIKKTLGRSPKTFVAGRWSENNDTVKALVKLGFTHDCSPNPGTRSRDWDWSRVPRICMPYRPSTDDYQSRGDAGILMVPISKTITNSGISQESVPGIGTGFLKAAWEEYRSQGMPLFHVYFHSPCMCSDYYLSELEKLLGFFAKQDGLEYVLPSRLEEFGIHSGKARIIPYLKRINRNIIRTAIRT